MDVTVITGQTATGKTTRALRLAKSQKADIISVDSRQAYRQLNIISGKDLPHDAKFIELTKLNNLKIGYYKLDEIRIWLYDLVELGQLLTPYDYYQAVKYLFDEIKPRSVIFVGGSYFYLKILSHGIDWPTCPPQMSLRRQLNQLSLLQLQQYLQKLDLDCFENLNHSDRHNPRRLVRKIEIISNQPKIVNLPPLINPNKWIGLYYNRRDQLQQVIKERIKKRMQMGALQEVKSLQDAGHKLNDAGLNTIGYKQLWKHLDGDLSLDEALKEWEIRELQYAKRQLTFMRSNNRIIWCNCSCNMKKCCIIDTL